MATFGHGKIVYLEIPTADVARSSNFYKAVFGWPIKRREDGATAFDDGLGGVSGTWVTGRPTSPNPGLLVYIMVKNVGETLDTVVRNGGRIIQPMGVDFPEMVIGRFADPDGNVLGLADESIRAV
jgi:predicted enzyme related to lactoylglutathione lyase